ncbi:hypothetical protein [Bradyrhizobium sp. 1]|uniref:AbiJ-NTD4 domain-containing protein n=1 Tax=Bradyrhizobium sp. 1 TaxID=241591 RepID=UPI001FFBF732|nr:hypothetical protein [Bradyrhizobium sp. 1]MCK1391622.1 hypothetical protein [Bradyrhizobium sp. 1]
MSNDTEQRKKLTFEQAEGAQPLPSQLRLKEVSRELRALLWARIHSYLEDAIQYDDYTRGTFRAPWSTIFKDEFVYRQHKMADRYENYADEQITSLRDLFEKGSYLAIFGWLEFVLKHPACPGRLPQQVENILRHCRAAYRVIDDVVICPIGSEAEHATVTKAFADLASTQFNGARAHLRNAATQLTAGAYADCVRESIHAVEAVGKTLDPTADILPKALRRLEQKIAIHPAMKNGFVSLYAYTSDEKGIRHALLDDGSAKVDEADALFMLGACAAFVSYMINKARSNGLLEGSDGR